jgi:hypothetical protein
MTPLRAGPFKVIVADRARSRHLALQADKGVTKPPCPGQGGGGGGGGGGEIGPPAMILAARSPIAGVHSALEST